MTRTQENIAVIRASDTVEKAHAFVCHADGSPCRDGCDVAADPSRLSRYHEAWNDGAAVAHVTGVPHPCDGCRMADGRDLAWCGGCDERMEHEELRPYLG